MTIKDGRGVTHDLGPRTEERGQTAIKVAGGLVGWATGESHSARFFNESPGTVFPKARKTAR